MAAMMMNKLYILVTSICALQMEFLLVNTIPYIEDGDHQLQDVSSIVRSQIDENNLDITRDLFNKYSNVDTIHEIMIEAVEANDIESIKKMIFEYKGYAPISWYILIPFINTLEVAQLIQGKLVDQHEINDLIDSFRRGQTAVLSINSGDDIHRDLYNAGRLFSQLETFNPNHPVIRIDMMGNISRIIRDYHNPMTKIPIGGNPYNYTDRRNHREYSIRDLRMKRDLLQWYIDNNYTHADINRIMTDLNEAIANRLGGIPPSDPIAFDIYLLRAAFNGRIDILDKYATKDNIIKLVVASFNPETTHIPPWMYRFLNYKAQEWGQPIDAWIANIVDDFPTTRLPPTDFWKKILATAAGLSVKADSVRGLANALIYKYRDQLTLQMKDRLRILSNGIINI